MTKNVIHMADIVKKADKRSQIIIFNINYINTLAFGIGFANKICKL